MADTNDVVSLAEAKVALKIKATSTNHDTNLAYAITAVSHLLDEHCGAIVRRIETNTVLTCHPTSVTFRGPIASVGSLNSYTGDVATSLAESATNGYRLTPKTSGTGTYTGVITRIGGTWGDRVVLNATIGRYTTTATVDGRFKTAAFEILRNIWRAEEISVGNVGEFDVPYQTFPSAFAIPNSVRDLLGDDWIGRKDNTMTPVMFG